MFERSLLSCRQIQEVLWMIAKDHCWDHCWKCLQWHMFLSEIWCIQNSAWDFLISMKILEQVCRVPLLHQCPPMCSIHAPHSVCLSQVQASKNLCFSCFLSLSVGLDFQFLPKNVQSVKSLGKQIPYCEDLGDGLGARAKHHGSVGNRADLPLFFLLKFLIVLSTY